jgi:uroporphyrinogen III methyltransferase/synthase
MDARPDARPLAGCRVLLTRPAEQAGPWRRAFEAAGAIAIDYPTVEVGPPADWGPLDAGLSDLASYDWLLFTSANALRFAWQRWPASAPAPAALSRPQVAAVGAQTARALAELGFRVARVPAQEDQDGLLAALADLPAGTRLLFPQAAGGRDTLASALRARGCTVDVVPASQTVARADLPPPPAFDVATFASPSALRALVDRHGAAALASTPLVVIGATTAAAAAASGLPCVTARSPRVEDVVEAIVLVYARAEGDR